MRRTGVPLAAAAVVAVLLGGCTDSTSDRGADAVEAAPVGVVAPDGLRVEVVAEDLPGPTQLVALDEDTVLVAVLNGAENDGTGQVRRIDLATGISEVVRDGLDKPTGIAWFDDELWVMERDRLSRGPLGAEATVVAENLPNNGRSQGTLTVTPDGSILFNTSGAKRGAAVTDGSGRLFTVDPAVDGATPEELASGFKNAYAHAFDGDGTLWSTEMSDGSFDGEPAADEVVAVLPGADHGWPFCVGDNRAVAEFGGDDQRCADVPRSQAVFAPGATPTSVTLSPFEPDRLLVALWTQDRIVSVDTTTDATTDTAGDTAVDTAGDAVAPVTDLITGLDRPQHLAVAGEALLISEFGTGRLLRVSAAG
ncbi:MAG: PQQ-dependent sugar dehydrogenase [Actinomycetota bacterium]